MQNVHDAQTSSGADTRNNNFDLIRLFAAWLVIFGHSHDLLGMQAPLVFGRSAHVLGVEIFFVMSGYLVTQSWQADPRVHAFLAKRMLRLFPALIACVLITVFVMGPLLTSQCFGCYFGEFTTWDYLRNMLLDIRFALPGVFQSQITPAVNGSLWTLPVEGFAYLTVLLVIGWPGRLRIPAFVLALVLVFWWEISFRAEPPAQPIVFYNTLVTAAVTLLSYFAIGVGIRLLGLERRLDVATGLLVVVVLALLPFPSWLRIIAMAVSVGWLTISVGLLPRDLLRIPSGLGDLSYGMYLWAFPIQQILVSVDGVRESVWWVILASTGLSASAAFLSWHLVEKRALLLKPHRKHDS